MKKIVCFMALVLFFAFACNKDGMPSKQFTQADLKTQVDKVSYGIGMDMGKNFKKNDVQINTELLLKGLNDSISGTPPLMTDDEMRMAMQEFQRDMMKKMRDSGSKKAVENREKGKKFLAENVKHPGVKTTASGLQYEIINVGSGEQPKPEDTVTVHYTGTLTDGTEFDSSRKRGEPTKFQLNKVIPGWTEGVGLMKPGAKYKFFIPDNLAYGERQMGDKIPPGSVLIFDVELISVEKAGAAASSNPAK